MQQRFSGRGAAGSRSRNTERVFTEIYLQNRWGGRDSVSGTGSDLEQTRVIVGELRVLLRELAISTMLDIPCGDFHWMKTVDLRDIDYCGADIVADLVRRNAERYGRDGLRFEALDVMNDTLPDVDLVLCRDCLVHFSFADALDALANICRSRSTYLLATTFTSRGDNVDIVTGRWRVLNLERAPFLLPGPLRTIHEGCTQGDGAYADKALGLWRIADVRDSLGRQSA